ncbi:hypothetical protein HELRODRAFT_68430 [Helobdella robusta]|uniref:Cyclin N-terminal domain-containing protein n=1 Tax=Helobdella robusta TaxID=6412 RepID=T1FZE6_HELRO|nr:hypothetical protein HELRODRAFT_68430 [Helobdella robusta]ESN96398.1 hypothetical protein HELRODRAFT_68430 [Helobdella robusta]
MNCEESPAEYYATEYAFEACQTRAKDGEHLLRDTRPLANMLQIEDNYQPSPKCLNIQKDITPAMRRIVSRWMLEVCEEQYREEGVFSLAMNYLDRVLSCHSVEKTKLQLLSVACLFIASKVKESVPFEAYKLVAYTDNSIELQDLLEWEMLVMQLLKWDTCAIIPQDYLHYLTPRLKVDPTHHQQIIRHAQTFISLCATEFKFAIQSSSLMACACICTAISGLYSKAWCENTLLYEQLHELTSIDIECIKTCQEQIEQLLTNHLCESTKASPQQQQTSSYSVGNTDENDDDDDEGISNSFQSTSSNPSVLSLSTSLIISPDEMTSSKTPTDVRDVRLVQ